MKKLIYLFLSMSLMVATISCNKDDEGAAGSNDIVGKWQFEKMGAMVEGQELLFPYPHSCSSKKDYIEFLPNGVGRGYSYNENCELEEGEGIGGWERDGNNLTIIDNEGLRQIFEIIILNSNILKIKGNAEREMMIVEFSRK